MHCKVRASWIAATTAATCLMAVACGPAGQVFDLSMAGSGGPSETVSSGVVADLPFGQIATVCGVPPARLGTEIDRPPGAAPYRLYDSNPRTTAPRPQFITGFKDGCARQFTAALVLFGSPAVHEAVRYNPQNKSPYSASDNAYEAVKSRLCGVRRGQSCPEARIDRLAGKSAFVSIYRRFGDSGNWIEMFLHDGEVAAFGTRTN